MIYYGMQFKVVMMKQSDSNSTWPVYYFQARNNLSEVKNFDMLEFVKYIRDH
jgi:hypothetical protein